jgi:hypothetical protein
MIQIKNSFDKITQEKMLKGFLLALSGGTAVALVAWLQGMEAAKSLILLFVSTAVPSILNGIREFKRGE